MSSFSSMSQHEQVARDGKAVTISCMLSFALCVCAGPFAQGAAGLIH